MFEGMREEESGHRRRLIELYRKKFGEHIPLIRRQDVRGFVERPALWLVRPLRIEAVRKEASTMEVETRRFYEKAAARTQDASIRQLLDDLINEEREHEERAQELDKEKLPANVKADEESAQRRLFVLQIVQPGLGRVDGWFGFHTCSGVRGRVRHAKKLGRISGGPGGISRSGHQHGIRRSAFG